MDHFLIPYLALLSTSKWCGLQIAIHQYTLTCMAVSIPSPHDSGTLWENLRGYGPISRGISSHQTPVMGDIREIAQHDCYHNVIPARSSVVYPLVICYSLLLKMTIEIVDLPFKMVIFHSKMLVYQRLNPILQKKLSNTSKKIGKSTITGHFSMVM